VTLTGAFPEPLPILCHLVELGFREVSLKSARLPPHHPLALTGASARRLIGGWRRLAKTVLEQAGRGEFGLLRPILGMCDPFGRRLVRLAARARVGDRCGAGRAVLAMDCEGNLYPCASFVGIRGWCVGEVGGGLDCRLLSGFVAASRGLGGGCARCWAFPLCGGPCQYNSWLIHGSLGRATAVECAVVKGLSRLAIWFWVALSAMAPAQAKALAREAAAATTRDSRPLAQATPEAGVTQ